MLHRRNNASASAYVADLIRHRAARRERKGQRERYQPLVRRSRAQTGPGRAGMRITYLDSEASDLG